MTHHSERLQVSNDRAEVSQNAVQVNVSVIAALDPVEDAATMVAIKHTQGLQPAIIQPPAWERCYMYICVKLSKHFRNKVAVVQLAQLASSADTYSRVSQGGLLTAAPYLDTHLLPLSP